MWLVCKNLLLISPIIRHYGCYWKGKAIILWITISHSTKLKRYIFCPDLQMTFLILYIFKIIMVGKWLVFIVQFFDVLFLAFHLLSDVIQVFLLSCCCIFTDRKTSCHPHFLFTHLGQEIVSIVKLP